MNSYPITSNCNFESRDDARGRAVHAARKAVESGRITEDTLADALDRLEDVLSEYADSEYAHARELCRQAEADVQRVYDSLLEA